MILNMYRYTCTDIYNLESCIKFSKWSLIPCTLNENKSIQSKCIWNEDNLFPICLSFRFFKNSFAPNDVYAIAFRRLPYIDIHALKAQDKKTIPFQYSGKGGGLAIKGKRTAIMRPPFGKWQYTEIFSEKSSLCTQSSRGRGVRLTIYC